MKKVVMITLVSTAALMLFAPSANAAPKEDKTDVGVSFKSDEPTIPGEHKPYKDNLAVVWRPSEFQFGEQKAVGGSATFNNIIDGKQYLVVNDDRQDESTPWELTARLSKMTANDESEELPSKLLFNLGDAQSYDIGDTIGSDNDYIPNRPEDGKSLGTLDPNAGITLGDGTNQLMTLEAGNSTSQPVFTKKKANDVKGGVATLIKDTKLVVTNAKQANAEGKSFKGQVTWTLDVLPDTPEEPEA